MGRSALAILIPAHNEDSTIGQLVAELSKSADVVVVDDGSQDQTQRIAKSGGAHVISLPENRGYDSALAAGVDYVRAAGYEGFVTCDGDGQHLARDIVYALELVGKYPLIVGVRDPLARLSERVFAQVASSSTGIKDPLCGLKAYRLEFVPRNFTRYLSRSSGTGLALKLASQGIQALNMSVSVQERASGSPRFGGSVRANAKIFMSLLKSLPLLAQAMTKRVMD